MHGSRARRRSSGQMIAVAVLVIIGVLAIIVGIIYLTEPAKSLPSILGTITEPASRANAHRSVRGWTAPRRGRDLPRGGLDLPGASLGPG